MATEPTVQKSLKIPLDLHLQLEDLGLTRNFTESALKALRLYINYLRGSNPETAADTDKRVAEPSKSGAAKQPQESTTQLSKRKAHLRRAG